MTTGVTAKQYALKLFERRGSRNLVFGGPKVGKSVFAVGFVPEGGKLAVIDYDGRIMDTIEQARIVKGFELSDVWTQPTFARVVEVLEKAKTWDKTRTLVFDGLTSWSEYELDNILATGKTATRESGEAGVEAYTQRVAHQTRVLMSLQLLRCNVVVIAHEEFVREKEDIPKENLREKTELGRTLRVPWVVGRSGGLNVGRYFDFVFYAQKGGSRNRPRFEIVTDSSGEIRCGGTVSLFEPVETMGSVTVKVAGKTRQMPAFDSYEVFQERLAGFSQGIEVVATDTKKE